MQSAACLWTAAIMKKVFRSFLGFVSILYYRECNKRKKMVQGGQKQSHELWQKDPVTNCNKLAVNVWNITFGWNASEGRNCLKLQSDEFVRLGVVTDKNPIHVNNNVIRT